MKQIGFYQAIVGVINATLLSAFITPVCLLVLDLFRNFKHDGWFVFPNLLFFNTIYMPMTTFLKFFWVLSTVFFAISFFYLQSKKKPELIFKGQLWFSIFAGNFITILSTIFCKGTLRILGFGLPIIPFEKRPLSGLTGLPIDWDDAYGFPFPFWDDLTCFWPVNFSFSFFFWFLFCYFCSRSIIKYVTQRADNVQT